MKIKEVIVVEGEHDATRLKQLFDVDVIVTNGSAINKKTLNLIKEVAKTRGVIVFTDPDYPGERIRKIISEHVPQAKQAFIRKKDAVDNIKKKVGVEHASDENIKEALKDLKIFDQQEDSLSYSDYISLGLVGDKVARANVCNALNIGKCNAKTLYKRLNMLGLDYDKVKEMCK